MAIFYLESLFYATVLNPSWEIFEKIPKFQKFKDAHTSNLKQLFKCGPESRLCPETRVPSRDRNGDSRPSPGFFQSPE